MILPLPVRFDANEWFVLISILVFFLASVFLPKRFPWIMTVLILLMNCALSKSVDFFIAAALPLDLYDYNDTKKLDLFDELLQFFLYPLAAYLLNYGYSAWKQKGWNRLLFVLLGAIASVGYEWLSLQCHVFTYKGWHLYYSVIAYVLLISFNIFWFERMRKWLPSQ